MKIQIAALAGLLAASAAQAVVINVADSTAPWLGFMNVSNLPSQGGAFQFASGWGIGDLNSSFNDGAHTLTLSPNTIGDPNGYWYTPSGGPGSQGNKIMDANLYQEVTGGLSGQSVTFQGNVISNTLTQAHTSVAFIKDFAPDYSSFNTITVPLAPGAFSITLATDSGAGRHVQWGFETIGVNVWFTDVAPFGKVVLGAGVPAPSALGLVGLTGLVATRRRRA